MARKNSTSTTVTEAEVTNTEEAPVTEQTTEAPAAAETSTETPIDLTAFQAASAEAVTEADQATGVPSVESVAKVNEQYRALDGQKPKNAARKWLEAQMMEAVDKLDAVLARTYSELNGSLTAAGGTKAEKAPADPTAAFVQRLASLRLASDIVTASKAENVSDDYAEKVEALVTESAEQVTAYQAWLDNEAEDKGDAPEVSPVVRAAFKAASGKGSGGGKSGSVSTGPRGDIAKHIQSAFADVESGTFLRIAEIAKHKSAEYPDAPPSQGAVSARLFPSSGNCTVEGVVPVDKDAGPEGKNPKGAVKA